MSNKTVEDDDLQVWVYLASFTVSALLTLTGVESGEHNSPMKLLSTCMTPKKWMCGLNFSVALWLEPSLVENAIRGNIYFNTLELFAFQ